jgi:glycosyltransferase involved in cell wall biosynthesis
VRERSVLQVLQPTAGGVAEHALHLSLGLRDRGWRVEVATSPDSGILRALSEAAIPVHPIELRRSPGWRDVEAARALRSIDRRGDYRIVHAHSSKAGGIVRAALPHRKRLVYTPHCFAFLAEFGRGRRLVYRVLEQALVPRCAAIIAVSDWERRAARRRLRGLTGRVRLIYNGMPGCAETMPDPAVASFKGDLPLVGFIGRLDPQKDPLACVGALAALRADGAPPFRAAIVGNGELADEVEAEIDRLGLDGVARRFPFAGGTERFLHAFDLFVMSSRWESMPLAVIEAMACGLPVVASAVGGVPEAVKDGVTGRLAPDGVPEALAVGVGELVAQPELRTEMGAAGRRLAAERFALERMVDETSALYDELLAGERRQAG